MDKQGKIAVAIAIAVLIGWQFYYTKNYKPPVKPAPTADVPAQLSASSPSVAQTPAAAADSKKAVVTPVEQSVPEQTQKVSTAVADYVFTNLGGGIARATLHDHKTFDGSADKTGKNVVLNENGSIPIGALSERAGEGATEAYGTVSIGKDGDVFCERTTPEKVKIVKHFVLAPNANAPTQYSVQLDVSFTNLGDQPYKSAGYFVYTGSAEPIHLRDLPTYTGYDWYGKGSSTYIDVNWFAAQRYPLVGIEKRPEQASYIIPALDIAWAGVKSQYFTTLITPATPTGTSTWARRFPVNLPVATANPSDTPKPMFGIEGALGMPGFELKPGESHTESFSIYAGPKEYSLMKKLGDTQKEIMNFGMFKLISIFLLKAMNTLKGLLGNYAAAILVLTLCIKSFMWPLQNKATQSMKKMQALAPKMTEIKEKYKDDPTRMNQETMKLYKDYGINPFGGCLPMFVQIPIFFGFYSMLGTAVELRNSTFLWVHDLSQPDTIAHFPLLGWPVNILPLCMAGTMLWQMALSPKSGDAVQQRVMMFTPLIFVVFCYNYASALALYWTVQNLFSVAQLYVTRSQQAPALQKISGPSKGKKR
jgi:YidC/Oxa1 family membrane protein insertase